MGSRRPSAKNPRTLRKHAARRPGWAGAPKWTQTGLGSLLRIERLEDRSLLSASGAAADPPGSTLFDVVSASSSPSGSDLTPSQISSAYGINSFGSTAGQGQTIVLFLYNDDPDIASDLASFDSYYGIAAPPSFQKVEQSGTTTDSTGQAEVEESLDVEWAHAMAPAANIVLYEANPSDSSSAFFAQVNTAATYGSVVSMSFTLSTAGGIPEESSSETSYDSDFTSSGVTYLGATGDYGAPGGYPAYSPNVVAVGGTDLTVSPSYSETVWSGSGNGSSAYEAEPSYQSNGTISDYTTSGSTTNASLVTGLTDPSGIAVSGSDLFVTNSNGTIGEYTTSGTTVNAALVSGLNDPLAIAVSGSDLFVTNSNGTIGEYTTSGATVNASLVSGLSTPSGITVSGSDLFVTNKGTGKIGEYTTSGATVNASLVSGLNAPSSITVSGSDLFVTTGNGRIGEYTTAGVTVSSSLVRNLSSPAGITVSGGDLFVTNSSTGAIGEYTTSGMTVNASLITGRADPRGIVASGSDLFVASDARAIPDVSAVAGTPVGIYDSFTSGGPWFNVEGTSLATPIWASIISIADQQRVAAYGSGFTLSGAAQTLPALYSAPSTDFRNANSSDGGDFTTGIGYEPLTGLGSPIVNDLVPDLVAYGTGTQLAVTAQPPGSVVQNTPFGLSVADEDSAGVVDTSYNGTVTISLGNNPGGSTLGGTLTATAVDGVATFSNLTLNNLGTGYTLHATASGLTATTTGGFNVTTPISAPVVTPSGNVAIYSLGGLPVDVDSGVQVSSNDSDLTGATIAISAGTLQSGDTLSFSSQNGITETSYSGGTLTLGGSASVTDYQTAMQSVTFSTSGNNTTTRALTIIADDNSLTSNPASEQVQVTATAPVVTPSGAIATFTVGGSAVAVDGGVSVSGPSTLTSASVAISAGTLQSGDTLGFSSQNGITESGYSSGTLTLSGAASTAFYQAALQSVTFSTTSDNTTTRALTIVADDNSQASSPASVKVQIAVNPPSLTSGGTPVSYTVGGSPTAIDPGVQVVAGSDASITGAQVDLTNPQTGDTLNFSSQNGITETSYSGGVLTLGGSATVAQYQTALASVTFSSSNTVTPSTTPRVVTIRADDTAASPSTSDTISDTVDVTIPPPSVTAGGSLAQYTAGANAVTVDGGIQVGSLDTGHLTGATMTISAGTLQSGDTLNFSSQNNITETSFTGGVLTLGGTASASAYQTALQSVTFNSSSTVTTNRAISVTVSDSNATPSSTGSASETVDVYAPATVTALYVKGTAWASSFNSYLGSHSLGNSATPSLGYALQTGTNQSKDLPWVNLNVIEATFSEAVNLTASSLVLTGSTQSGYSVPSVTGFSTVGTSTYAWTLSSSLTANRLEISFLSSGANPVTDSNGAGLSGNWTNGSSSFSPVGSGDGLAGTASGPNSGVTSDFNFLFNALPGDAARNGITVNPTDATDVKNKSGANTGSSNYVPYYDVIGSGVINPTDYTDVKNRSTNAQASTSFGPSPQDSGVGGLTTTSDDADLTGGFLAVQEGSTGQTGGRTNATLSNSTGAAPAGAESGVSFQPAVKSSDSGAGAVGRDRVGHRTAAADQALADFELTDLWV